MQGFALVLALGVDGAKNQPDNFGLVPRGWRCRKLSRHLGQVAKSGLKHATHPHIIAAQVQHFSDELISRQETAQPLMERFMPKHPDCSRPVRDLAKEQMSPTTMHGTRDNVVIACSRQDPYSAIGNDNRSFMSKLGDKVINHLHKLAL